MRSSRSFLSTAALFLAVSVLPSRAEGTAPPPAPTPSPAATAPAPAPAPLPAPPAGAGAVPAIARREDTEVRVNADLNLIQRAVARLSGIPTDSAAIQQLATAQSEIASLRTQLATVTAERDAARQQVATYQQELSALHAVFAAPDPAAVMQTPEGAAAAAAVSANVAGIVRTIGVDASVLPQRKPGAANASGGGIDALRDAFAAEKDPLKKAVLARQLKTATAAAAAGNN